MSKHGKVQETQRGALTMLKIVRMDWWSESSVPSLVEFMQSIVDQGGEIIYVREFPARQEIAGEYAYRSAQVYWAGIGV